MSPECPTWVLRPGCRRFLGFAAAAGFAFAADASAFAFFSLSSFHGGLRHRAVRARSRPAPTWSIPRADCPRRPRGEYSTLRRLGAWPCARIPPWTPPPPRSSIATGHDAPSQPVSVECGKGAGEMPTPFPPILYELPTSSTPETSAGSSTWEYLLYCVVLREITVAQPARPTREDEGS